MSRRHREEDWIPLRLTPELLALAAASARSMNRTQAGPFDALVGKVGEVAFADRFFGDPRWPTEDGRVDFCGIEVKCSQTPLRDWLHLLVKEEYALKREPIAYVQLIVDKNGFAPPSVDDAAHFCGWATHDEVMNGSLKDWGKKGGGPAGYRCYGVPFRLLNRMASLRDFHRERYFCPPRHAAAPHRDRVSTPAR